MLEGKIVKLKRPVKDKEIDFPQLLQFYNPGFVIRSELTIFDKDKNVIYVGDSHPNMKQWLSERTKSFVSLVGPYEIDLSDKKSLLEVVAETRGKKPSEKILEIVKDLDIWDVDYIAKVFYMTGKWVGESCDMSLYTLFKDSVESKNNLVTDYMKLRESYSYSIIRNSFLTFLVKCCNPENVPIKTRADGTKNTAYRDLCTKANSKFGGKERIINGVYKFGRRDDEQSFIYLLMWLSGWFGNESNLSLMDKLLLLNGVK